MACRLLALVALAAILAGCGGGSPRSAVANLGATATSTASGRSPSGGSVGGRRDQALAYSRCMRRNGVPDFPDPTSSGTIQLAVGNGLDPGSPRFQAARASCRTLAPHGPKPTQAQIAKAEADALAFARCMREHGVAGFPDPDFKSSVTGFSIHVAAHAGLDPGSPLFQAAQKACFARQPGGGPKGSPGQGISGPEK